MRRLSSHAVDELELLLRASRAFRESDDGNHLPGYAETILYFLAGQPNGAAGMGDLRKRLGLGQSRSSRLCASLMRAGLVEIVIPTENRRVAIVRLTAKARRLIDRVLSATRSRSK